MTRAAAYFERQDTETFVATDHVSGAWDVDDQHVGPALGLLVHVVETDARARGRSDLVLGRLSFDILGTMRVGPVAASAYVVRPGRTIELVEATLTAAGRDTVRLRAWLLQACDSASVAGSAYEPLPPPADMPAWDPTSVWPGGFIASASVRREETQPGRARYWVRTDVPLLADEPVSRLAGATGLIDIANGMTVRISPRSLAFPNVDLTAHLFAQPRGEWLGFDTTVSFGSGGLGVTSSVLHDALGPIGVLAQALTLRPLPAAEG